MSSPTVSTFQSGRVGTSIARLVLPQADGKAPVTYLTSPAGEVSLRISMCSASQPSSRAIAARHPRGDPQREALLAQQRIAAVARAVGPDFALLGVMDDVLGVVAGP